MRFAKLAIAGAIAGAIITGGIGVASADVEVKADACGADRVCIYKHNNFYVKIGERAPFNGVANIALANNDEMSSWKNRTNVRAAWYHDQNGRGRCVGMASVSNDADINSLDDNKLSSWRTDRGC
ncbi:hypothetical protein FHS29_005230 [Saccharothrix tamanrassetensis]|uniref:Peptidase inhibitor family I36 n=1 Tax=Saccharothrix tamanrassetensis TaxID=1051531 RepID=A0A841CJG8_9PSEU|nr:peptidase inhibitor family I36 protein [Saccharothrix tamanrassetensis]MBB5958622.1 hypothetical protein [Saccharothrix tamanrassetensis]